MEQIPLNAQKRTVLGKKVKTLRHEGLIPAHVFGHKIPTIHVQVKKTEFGPVFEKVGETGIISLDVDKEKRPVMVRNVQVHPVSDDLLHIDFYQVNLSEKVTVNVPVEVVGEALPADIPEKIEVDVTKLVAIGDETKIKDLPIDRSKIEVKTDEELVVAQIGELVTKEMEAVEAEMEAEAAAAQVEEAPAEGEAAEGEPRPEGREAKAEGEEGAAKAEADGSVESKPEENKEAPAEKPEEGKKEE